MMLTFGQLEEKKKTKCKINPSKDDLMETPKKHGEDCTCIKCDKRREKDEGGEGPTVESWKPEIEHSKMGDATKKAAEKKRKKAEDGLPPHLKLDVMKKAFAHTNEERVAESLKQARKNVGMDPDKPSCWKGYKATGTKMKGGKKVPDCKKEEVLVVDEAKKKDYTYLETDFKKRLKNNEKARKDLMKGPQMKNPHLESKSYASQEEISEERPEESRTENLLTFNNFHEATRLKKEKGYNKGGSDDKALNFVKTKIRKEIGKPEGQRKKVKGAKSDAGTGKYKRRADDKKAYAARAKKAGFKSTQNYTDVVARYGGEDNYKKGKGLGT